MNSNHSSSGQSRRARVLLLHPEDHDPPAPFSGRWDLIVDFGHAASQTHQQWSRQTGCRVLNLFDFSEDIQDLYRTRDLLQFGMGQLVDRFGIDWWDVFALTIKSELVHLQMVLRLSREIDSESELYMSRPLTGARALAQITGSPLNNLESRTLASARRAQRYFHVISRFNPALTWQILQDKFDRNHALRSRLNPRRRSSRKPQVLLPSAYVNVSRAEIELAANAPQDQFLLVYTRRLAEVTALPANVESASLDSYFGPAAEDELATLSAGWMALRARLISRPEFAAADAAGILAQVSALLPWGISVRDAWMRLFDDENFTACLTADDSNPYTRLPLIIAKKRGIAAFACHHGALDYAMAMKTNHADFYLAKTAMERDYLVNVCHVTSEAITTLAPSQPMPREEQDTASAKKCWMVFFTENSLPPWRGDEVFRELMPVLATLARDCGLKLVFKLHPFENRHSYAKWIERYLPGEAGRRSMIQTGAPSAELWGNTRFALTVQSSAALECHARGIPVFLCGWLREPSCGYLEQYARFGVGQVLQSPEEVAEIPRLLQAHRSSDAVSAIRNATTSPVSLHELLHRTDSLTVIGRAQSAGD